MSEPNDPKSPLPYRDWKADAPLRHQRVGFFTLGFFLSAIVVFVCGFVWGLYNFHESGKITIRQWQVPSAVSVIGLALLMWTSFMLHRRGGNMFLAGLIAGFCAMLIFEGFCFSA